MPLLSSRTLPALSLAAALAACAQTGPAPGPVAPAPQGRCDASGAQFAVGRPLSDALAEEARRRAGAALVRVIRPGQVVTMEFNPARLNLRVDGSDRVQQASCG